MHPLLIPRYKVIAPWPKGHIPVGTILYKKGNTYTEKTSPGYYFSGDISLYPHLFRKLNWWEDREESEMPEWVKLIETRTSYGLPIGHVGNASFTKSSDGGWIVDMFPVYIRINHIEPATESEYLTFINGK